MFTRKVSIALGVALTAVICSGALAQQSPPNPRVALVIGESAYPDHPLATTANDAGLIAQTLQAAGFDVVGARDLDEKSLRQALRDFIDKSNAAGPDGIDFVYLSGRALQYAGDNYFVPVDAQIARDVDVPIEAVKISDFTHALAAVAGRAHVVVIDGARANNYAPDTPLAPGLALVDAEKGELVAFNAAPGTLAPDETGAYGVYGKDLAGALRQGGVPLEDIFTQVRLQVNQDTAGAVVPWNASNLGAPVYIFERAADSAPPPVIAASKTLADRPLRALGAEQAYAAALERDSLEGYQEYVEAYPTAPEARRIRAILAARREALFWRRCVMDNTPRAYWTYLNRYPNGPHVADASRRLAILSAPEAAPVDFAPVEFADLPPPPPDEGFYAEQPIAYFGGDDFGPPPPPPPPDFAPDYGDDWRDLPPPPPPVSYGYLPVLPIAIPLVAGAVVVTHEIFERERRERRERERTGVAPPGVPAAPPHGAAPAGQQGSQVAHANAPSQPPPLPKGVAPKAPPPPQHEAPKLLIPGTPGARPVSTAPAAIKAAPAAAGAHAPSPPAPAHALPSATPPAGGHALPSPAPPPPAAHAPPNAPSPAGHALPEAHAPAGGHALPAPAAPPPPAAHIAPPAPSPHAAPPPAAHIAPPAPSPHAAPPPAARIAPPAPSPHAPPPPAAHVAPPPAVHVAPPAPPPHVAPPPAAHIAPPAPPPHAAPPPAAHPAPARPGGRPNCGGPGQPSCPK